MTTPWAWATHHDEPMIFPTRAEALEYCNDDEEPIPLAPIDHIPDATKMILAGWFREVPSAMSHRLWEQGGHEWEEGDVALYFSRGEK